MREWHRFTIAAVVCTVGVTLACSGKTTGGGGGSGSACDDYFQAIFTESCNGSLTPPASEIARLQSRFETLCADALALPGVGITSGALESCASAIKSGGCAVTFQRSGPCSLNAGGSLALGSTCVTSAQCQSGSCSAGNVSADGGSQACGTCGAAVAIGQPCGSNGASCPQGAACGFDSGTGAQTCQAITYVGAGGSCNEVSTLCNQGLVCSFTKGQCVTPGGAGAACQNDQDCAFPLICPAVTGSSTCQSPGAAGAPCMSDMDCTGGLGCAQSNHQCSSVTWAKAGEPCNESIRCLVGSCPQNGPTGNASCPTVIADGQPCNSTDSMSTCDTLANCQGGTCVFGYATCH